ncbi:acetate kinase [Saccharomonospora marina XMU15]|uniref:Acetate kinase n=1 Tax=Saccharomonospora marina XMU15 TaxID=882083 RepID=H5X0S8_9PSEU|nr:acetate/propionate family kinase [Saccharomonospora marina]EHR50874.1 acetate kinase [Saccharomonospora marina XMU15]
MRVLTLNPGSSSLKLALVRDGAAEMTSTLDKWDGSAPPGLAEFAAAIDAVAVRIVHGGNRAEPVVLTERALAELEELTPYAALHQPRSLAIARHAMAALPRVPVVGCFDTAFHADLPARASTYAVPAAWRREHGIRRYGFHGLSVAYATAWTARLLGRPVAQLGMVCCHLGAGVSVTAVEGGRSVDTSMGLTPLDGVPMATRSGAIDPAIPLYLVRRAGMSPADVERALQQESGLAGLSGTSGDIRDVLAARALGDPDARLAVEVYLHRLRREIAAAVVSLSHVDAVVLTGGVAEHQPDLMAELVAGAGLGLSHASARRAAAGGDGAEGVISPPDAPVPVVVVTSREDLELASQTEHLLGSTSEAGRVRQATEDR